MKAALFKSSNEVVGFYEERFQHGYMDEWPHWKKQRIFRMIRMLELPEKGNALDYGCGAGVFSGVIGQALPGWNIYGADISTAAIRKARQRYPHYNFFVLGREASVGIKFDFLFSHHVLEHVVSLVDCAREIDSLLSPKATMLHIAPCGNKGSFEHKLCLLRTDGIDYERGNRFFFEDKGHLRRLTTYDLSKVMKKYGFELSMGFYAYQSIGAIDWILDSGMDFIRELTDTSRAVNAMSYAKLKSLKIFLFIYGYLRQYRKRYERAKELRGKSGGSLAGSFWEFPLYLFCFSFDTLIRKVAEREWQIKKQCPNGSEFYLCYSR